MINLSKQTFVLKFNYVVHSFDFSDTIHVAKVVVIVTGVYLRY